MEARIGFLMVKGQQRLWILRTSVSSFRHDIRSLRREGHDGRNSTADEPVRPDVNHHIRQHNGMYHWSNSHK